MKRKSVIAISLCLIASMVTLFSNKIYMLYIGDCHQLWEEAQTHYVNQQDKKAKEALTKIKSDLSEEDTEDSLLFT